MRLRLVVVVKWKVEIGGGGCETEKLGLEKEGLR